MEKGLTKNSKITFVELPPTEFGILNGEPIFDEFSFYRLPSRAIDGLASILRANGWTDVVCINPQYNGRKRKLTKENMDRIFSSDCLCGSAITRTLLPTISLLHAYKSYKPEGITIAGGAGPTFHYEEMLRGGVDIVVRKEGDATTPILFDRLIKDRKNLEDITGLAFRKNGDIVLTPDRKLLNSFELGEIPHKEYDERTRRRIDIATIETSRGCPNNCDFCSESEFHGRKFRVKPIDYVLRDLRKMQGIGHGIFYVDNNFAGSPNYTANLLGAIVEEKLNKKFGIAQVTVDTASNPKLLEVLKKAGIRMLCVGIESINDETLKALGKPYSAEKNKKAISTFREAGFWIHGMMIPWGDFDTKETLRETSEWAKKDLDSVQYFPLAPAPGADIFPIMEREGRILTKKWHLYDGHNVLLRSKNFTPYEFQTEIFEMYKDFYSFGNNARRLIRSPDWKVAMGILVYTNILRGISKVLESQQMQEHLKFLKSVS
jgi:radical SAM superfamily enzyme YgiQ (UPF0313 family)